MRSKTRTICVLVVGFLAGGGIQALGQAPARVESPKFGTSSRIQYHVGFDEFRPSDSLKTWDFVQTATSTGLVNNSPATFWASPHIPTGARLLSFELDYCDFDPSTHISLALIGCDFLGANCATLGTMTTAEIDSCGFLEQDLSGLNYTMQNNAGELFLIAAMHSSTNQNTLLGAYIGYQLQVSPAPGVATFGDVPTTSPQFRFVEALVAAGITAGCGGGNYCPTAPITRGQMAVFLATALGLHFPN